MSASDDSEAASPRGWPAAEQLTLDLAERSLAVDTVASPRVLMSSTSRGQAAAHLAASPADVTLFDIEHFHWALMRDALAADGSKGRENLRILCDADPPDEEFDLAVLAIRRDWQAELSRDLIQLFASRVSASGTLAVVVDHPDDHWLGEQLRELSKAVKRTTSGAPSSGSRDHAFGATGYVVRTPEMRLRLRDFSCQFAFRDHGRLIQAVSRPGVFSHRRLDLGARRLMDAMQVSAGQRVLDIGCGSGPVGLAAAFRAEDVQVVGIDSNSRAVACMNEGARLNGVQSRVVAHRSSDGNAAASEPFDVAVANPPYFANFRIADLFLVAAHRGLRAGGQMWIVGKHPDWYQANVPRLFDRVKMNQVGGGYWITTGTRPT